MKTKVLFLMALLCLVVGKVSAYDWQGQTLDDSKQYYLYNAGFKAFLTSDGVFADNPKNATMWSFAESADGGMTISSEGKYIWLTFEVTYKKILGINTPTGISFEAHVAESVSGSSKHNNFEITRNTSKNTINAIGEDNIAYKFTYNFPGVAGLFKGPRYFNVDNSDGRLNAAETEDVSDAWLLITQDQVDDYNAQSESWVSDDLPSGEGEYYLYNVAYAEYMYADLQNSWASLTDISNATKFTITKTNKGYTISSGGSYYYLNASDGKFEENKTTDWTFENKGAGYQIYASSRYIQGHGTSVYCKKTSESDFDIRETYWILISANQYKEDMNQTITIGSTGYTTFSTTHAIDLGKLNNNVIAYVATSNNTSSVTIVQQTGVVPANTGLILFGTAGTKVTIPFSTDEATAPQSNLLEATTNITVVAAGNYVLAKDSDGKAKFFLVAESNKPTLSSGKAYLKVPTTPGSKSLNISFGEESTSISAVANSSISSNDIYSVSGTRQNALKKGVNVVKMTDGNIKKIFVK